MGQTAVSDNQSSSVTLNKDYGKSYLLCLLLYILKFALDSQVNIESIRVLLTDTK